MNACEGRETRIRKPGLDGFKKTKLNALLKAKGRPPIIGIGFHKCACWYETIASAAGKYKYRVLSASDLVYPKVEKDGERWPMDRLIGKIDLYPDLESLNAYLKEKY